MRMRSAPVTFAGLALAGAAAAADGLAAPETDTVWPQWQARVQLGSSTLAPVTLSGGTRNAGSVLGDYYFDVPGLRVRSLVGGLRATSGVTLSGRGLPLGAPGPLRLGATAWSGLADDAAQTLPYVGLGYSAGTRDGAWNFSADIGLVGDRADRVRLGEQPLDRALREMQLAPVLQLGVRYAF
ncbi:hypothetical protein CKO44_06485 [Rubrivivax gelatinosus]|uniref:Outer membrane protein beta-barrel domain-containing protein n=1 Tax=Rubrivivax gelatinosus TaxID=28068 RepID=A0ABS1DTZ5_RUBGE|nr:hypothetical protein [Rubrivivax gelatinosus]MBK1613119.1 hypothetical protein [Rubrivivax gelatinosus]MBK1712606.1 hypothetical protein [Rubrivivax gelatinosus]